MGAFNLLGKIKEALKASEEKKKHETSRINLDAELEAVRARLEAEALAKIHEEAKAAKAGNGK